MTVDFAIVQEAFSSALGRVFPAAQIEVRRAGEVIFSESFGWVDPESKRYPAGRATLFDLASVTKLFAATAFMSIVEEGRVGLDQPVGSIILSFNGERTIQAYEDPLTPGAEVAVSEGMPAFANASEVTFRHLLSHSSGLPAWRPLFHQENADAGWRMAVETPFFYAVGQTTVYSDIGLILLGRAMEMIEGKRLDAIIQERVNAPLGNSLTRYLPVGEAQMAEGNVVPTEYCAWRKRRAIGEVHDENCAFLGGVTAHAGLFSTASELANLGQAYLEKSAPLLAPQTTAEMTRIQAQKGDIRRGLGFALWSPDPEASGNAFGNGAFGHTGFTGTSLWIDPKRNLVVAMLTNRVYYGRNAEGITAFRATAHRAIVEAVGK